MAEVIQRESSLVSPLSGYYLWQGVPDVSANMLKQFDPAYTGYAHVFMIRQPRIFTDFTPVQGGKKNTEQNIARGKNFYAAVEKLTTSFSGIPELSLQSVDQTAGFADKKIPHATTVEFNWDTISLRMLEVRGHVVHDVFREWIEMMGDPITKISDYKGLAQSMAGGRSITNHTATIMLVNTDPTMTKLVGRAYAWTAAFPTNITNEPFNWQGNEIGIVDGYDIQFKGVPRWGEDVDLRAYQLLTQRRQVVNYYADKKHPGASQRDASYGRIPAQTNLF